MRLIISVPTFISAQKRKKKGEGAGGSAKNIMKGGLRLSSQGVISPLP